MKRGPLFYAVQKRFRSNRFAEFEKLLRSVLQQKDTVRVLDAGGRGVYWEMLPRDLRSKVRISILNFESENKQYDKVADDLDIEYVVGDACAMPQYADGSFDIVHSNSVIEHVGSWQKMADFAREVSRVGVAYYVQTPNFWFPIEPHYGVPFFHWLSEPTRVFLHVRMRVGYLRKLTFPEALEAVDHHRILNRTVLVSLFPDGHLIKERLLLLTKSLIVIRS